MDEVKVSEHVAKRVSALHAEQQLRVAEQTDRLLAGLMVAQWALAVVFALVVSPRSWEGLDSAVHSHVWAAILIGGALTAFPVFLALRRTGQTANRYVIAVAQMLMSSLLIHLSGGRIETHFHVFGSLAFLAFYRDWRVLIPATVTIALDHLLRGIFFPQSVYGVASATIWRTLEHAAWVLFEDAVLIAACLTTQKEMRRTAEAQARLEDTNQNIETRVLLRTAELRDSEERYRSLVTGSPVALLHVDGQGNCLYVTDACLALAGLGRDELLGQNWTGALHPDDRGEAAKMSSNGGGAREFRTKKAKVRVSVGELGAHGDGILGRVIAMDKVS